MRLPVPSAVSGVVASTFTSLVVSRSKNQRCTVAKEAGAGEQNVRLMQRHRPPLGDLPRFVQVCLGTRFVTRKATLPGSGQQATREVAHVTGRTEAVDGCSDVVACGLALVQGGSGQSEVVQGVREEPKMAFGPSQCL